MVESDAHGRSLLTLIVQLLEFDKWDVPDRLEETPAELTVLRSGGWPSHPIYHRTQETPLVRPIRAFSGSLQTRFMRTSPSMAG